MTKYLIRGGKPLYGEVDISGAKNAAVAIIPAALMVDGVCRIENLPQISDVTLLLHILQDMGADVRTVNRTTVEIDASRVRRTQVPQEELSFRGTGIIWALTPRPVSARLVSSADRWVWKVAMYSFITSSGTA